MPTLRRNYGWIPDLPDHRDRIYGAVHAVGTLPPKVDLHTLFPPIYNQGELGSCTANALAAAIDFERNKQKLPFLSPSRLFIYYNERLIENTVSSDSGAALRDGMKTIATQGACGETLWPYDPTQCAVCPPATCYQAALEHRTISYSRLPRQVDQFKACLASGYPFVFGLTVYDSFESDSVAHTGMVSMPMAKETALGGHAVVAVGYSDASQRFLCRNSWGAEWGINGHFTLPYEYLANENLADDFWTIRTVQ